CDVRAACQGGCRQPNYESGTAKREQKPSRDVFRHHDNPKESFQAPRHTAIVRMNSHTQRASHELFPYPDGFEPAAYGIVTMLTPRRWPEIVRGPGREGAEVPPAVSALWSEPSFADSTDPPTWL